MSKNAVKVEIYYNGVWNDITSNDEVFTSAPIVINQGQTDENSGLRPCSINLKLNNARDSYRISNPMSPLYRLVGRNTPIRVSVGDVVRGIAEIKSWDCDQSQDFRYTPRRGKAWTDITSGGVLDRVNKWSRKIRSPLYRSNTLADPATYTLAEYWDQEVPSGGAEAPSAVGGNPLRPVTAVRYTLADGSILPPGGAPDFGKGNGVIGSDPLPNFQQGGTLYGIIRTATYNGYAIDWMMQFQANTDEGGTTSADVLRWTESGTYQMFTVNVVKNNVTVFHATAADALTLASTGSASATFDMYDGTPHHFRYQVRQSGGNYLAQLYIDSAVYATADNFVPGMTGTIGIPRDIQWNPGEQMGDYMPIAAGHLAIWNSGQIGGQPPTFFARNGWAKETTSTRLNRIYTEENIDFAVVGTTALAQELGPQKTDTLFNLTQEIKTSEDGLVYDDISNLRVLLKLRNVRYNQTPVMTLYPTDFPSLPKETSDNQDIHNVITVTQRDGGQAVAEDSTSFLGSQDSPNGIGEEKDDVKVNLYNPTDDLPQHANWWLRRDTVDLPRFPQLVLDLNAVPSLITTFNNLRVGNVIEIVGMRENTIRLFVLGWTEVIGTHSRMVTLTCKPDQQFKVGTYDDGISRFNSKTTTNKTALTNVGTSVTFTLTDSNALWSTTSVPYDVFCDGERWTVTSMGAATGTGPYEQVATVVRSVNGVIKTIAAGKSISIATPGRWAL